MLAQRRSGDVKNSRCRSSSRVRGGLDSRTQTANDRKRVAVIELGPAGWRGGSAQQGRLSSVFEKSDRIGGCYATAPGNSDEKQTVIAGWRCSRRKEWCSGPGSMSRRPPDGGSAARVRRGRDLRRRRGGARLPVPGRELAATTSRRVPQPAIAVRRGDSPRTSDYRPAAGDHNRRRRTAPTAWQRTRRGEAVHQFELLRPARGRLPDNPWPHGRAYSSSSEHKRGASACSRLTERSATTARPGEAGDSWVA